MSQNRPPPGNLPVVPAPSLSREERLAAKLRENLRRRKGQARAIAGETDEELGALPKSPGKS